MLSLVIQGKVIMGKCPDCFQEFTYKGDMYRHRRKSHGFVTCICGRQFLKIMYMEQHIKQKRKHVPETGRFECVDCLRRFRRNSHLKKHMAMKGHDGITSLQVITPKPSSSNSDDKSLYSLRSNDIDKFIDHYVQADDQFLRCCGKIIDTLVHHINGIPGKLQSKRIIKSGSLGKGTAVKDRSDIDLIMMLNNYTNVDELMKEMPNLLEDLEKHLQQFSNTTLQRRTHYSVQVEITCASGHSHDADILPAVDLLELGNTAEQIFEMMKSAKQEIIHEYSVSLAPLQLEIIKHLPAKVKSLIKLVKYWKDKKLKENKESELSSFAEKRTERPHWPSSYSLELIVINAWNDAGNLESFDMTKALHDVLTSLVNHQNFKIVLSRQMKYQSNMLHIGQSPYIMDPVNPYNDMYHGLVWGKTYDWDRVAPEAKSWLSKPLFTGINTSKEW